MQWEQNFISSSSSSWLRHKTQETIARKNKIANNTLLVIYLFILFIYFIYLFIYLFHLFLHLFISLVVYLSTTLLILIILLLLCNKNNALARSRTRVTKATIWCTTAVLQGPTYLQMLIGYNGWQSSFVK